jgi:hypothetical protein
VGVPPPPIDSYRSCHRTVLSSRRRRSTAYRRRRAVWWANPIASPLSHLKSSYLLDRDVNVCPYAGNIFTAKKVYIFTIKSTVFFFHVMRRIFILSFLILSADTDFVL